MHVDGEDRAAHVVHVVVVAVVGRADRDDRLQRLGGERGDPERDGAAPGDAEHADPAGAPLLPGQPVDDGDPVGRPGRVVLVARQPLTVAVPTGIDAYGGVAVARVPGVALPVARRRPVAQPVRQVLQERRYGLVGDRPPDPGVQPCAVRQRDPDVLVGRVVGEPGADVHGVPRWTGDMGRLGDGAPAAPTVAWTAPPTIGRAMRLRGDRELAVVAAPGQVTPDRHVLDRAGRHPDGGGHPEPRGRPGAWAPGRPERARASPGGGWVRPAATVLLDNPNIPAVAGRRPR